MASKMPSSASLWALAVAQDQLVVVEVVAGVHADARGQPPPQVELALAVEQRELDAVDLGGVVVDQLEAGVHRAVEVARAPVAGERGVEHVAEPVQDHRAVELGQDPVVDGAVVGRAGRGRGQVAARHQHDAGPLRRRAAPARGRRRDPVERARARPAGSWSVATPQTRPARPPASAALRSISSRVGVVEAHAALRRVHAVGDAEAPAPQVAAVGEGRVPVELGAAASAVSGSATTWAAA
jgi:hypothetical protein